MSEHTDPNPAISVEASPDGLTSIARREDDVMTRIVIGDGSQLFQALRQPPHRRNVCVTSLEWSPPDDTWECPLPKYESAEQMEAASQALVGARPCEMPGCPVCLAVDALLCDTGLGWVWLPHAYDENSVFRLTVAAAAIQCRRIIYTTPKSKFEPDTNYSVRVPINPVDLCKLWADAWKPNCGRIGGRSPTPGEWLDYARSADRILHKYRLPIDYLVGAEANLVADVTVTPYTEGLFVGNHEVNPALWTQFPGF